MQVEYEATFANIDKDEVREKLKSIGAQLVRPEFMQNARDAKIVFFEMISLFFQKKIS